VAVEADPVAVERGVDDVDCAAADCVDSPVGVGNDRVDDVRGASPFEQAVIEGVADDRVGDRQGSLVEEGGGVDRVVAAAAVTQGRVVDLGPAAGLDDQTRGCDRRMMSAEIQAAKRSCRKIPFPSPNPEDSP